MNSPQHFLSKSVIFVTVLMSCSVSNVPSASVGSSGVLYDEVFRGGGASGFLESIEIKRICQNYGILSCRRREQIKCTYMLQQFLTCVATVRELTGQHHISARTDQVV